MKKIDYDGSKNIIGSRLETLRREKDFPRRSWPPECRR